MAHFRVSYYDYDKGRTVEAIGPIPAHWSAYNDRG